MAYRYRYLADESYRFRYCHSHTNIPIPDILMENVAIEYLKQIWNFAISLSFWGFNPGYIRGVLSIPQLYFCSLGLFYVTWYQSWPGGIYWACGNKFYKTLENFMIFGNFCSNLFKNSKILSYWAFRVEKNSAISN